MSFFGRSDGEKPEESKSPYEREQRNNVRAAIRVLVILYILYIVFKLIRGYLSGDADITLGVVVLACALFLVCCVYFAITFYKEYRREQAHIADLREDIRREREAAEAEADGIHEDTEDRADQEDGEI